VNENAIVNAIGTENENANAIVNTENENVNAIVNTENERESAKLLLHNRPKVT
jgi:hypothetical protein